MNFALLRMRLNFGGQILLLMECLLSLALLPGHGLASIRGKAILHRLNKSHQLLLANNRNSTSSSSSFAVIHGHGNGPPPSPFHSTTVKSSAPVFNYGGSSFIGRENELGTGSGNGNGTAADWPTGGDGADLQRQMLTAMPDLSDPCFRRYTNSIIVNAQPYERRSSISLIHCKLQCLRSQLGIYSCRSFVYDNVNQVCDLFAHVGDQSPAKLLRFQTRDYFEPTAAIHCVPPPASSAGPSGTEEGGHFAPAMGVQQQTQVPPAPVQVTLASAPIVWPTMAVTNPTISIVSTTTVGTIPLKTSTGAAFEQEGDEDDDEEGEEENAGGGGGGSGLTLLKPSAEEDGEEEEGGGGGGKAAGEEDSGEDEANANANQQRQTTAADKQRSKNEGNGQKGCLPGQVARFLRTKDFELFGHDQHRMAGVQGEQRCLDLCAEQGNASVPLPVQCNSLEYSSTHGECVFSVETAVPVGNGQLRQRPGTDYFERVCVDQRLASDCRNSIYRRFPQMILVGFAETVVDSASLQQCLDNCLNSQQLYGFRCSSGMFYFEEPQLNCILNTEDRESQPDLFTTETSDLVDYFETGCPEARLAMPKNVPIPKEYEDETNEPTSAAAAETAPANGGFRKRDFVVERTRRERVGWTQWTVCQTKGQWTTLGTQARWRVCAGGRVCGKEERQCILAGAGRKASGVSSSGQQSTRGKAQVKFGYIQQRQRPQGQHQHQQQQQNNEPWKGSFAPTEHRKMVAAATAIGTATTVKRGGGGNGTIKRAPTKVPMPTSAGGEGGGGGRQQQNLTDTNRAKPRKCRSEECCPLLGTCHLGIRFGAEGKNANWCKNPCG